MQRHADDFAELDDGGTEARATCPKIKTNARQGSWAFL
jgi:hypothetical protein